MAARKTRITGEEITKVRRQQHPEELEFIAPVRIQLKITGARSGWEIITAFLNLPQIKITLQERQDTADKIKAENPGS